MDSPRKWWTAKEGLASFRDHDVFLNFTPDLISQRCLLFVLVLRLIDPCLRTLSQVNGPQKEYYPPQIWQRR